MNDEVVKTLSEAIEKIGELEEEIARLKKLIRPSIAKVWEDAVQAGRKEMYEEILNQAFKVVERNAEEYDPDDETEVGDE